MMLGTYAEYPCAGQPPGRQAARSCRLQVRRRGDAAGHDRALPDPQHVSAESRRHRAGARGRRRRRPAHHRRPRGSAARASSRPPAPKPRPNSRATLAPSTLSSTRDQDFEAEVKRLTGGRGVDVVYDSVGKDTFDQEPELPAARGRPGALWLLERRRARRSTRRCSAPRGRCSSPGQASINTSLRARSCCRAPPTSSRG